MSRFISTLQLAFAVMPLASQVKVASAFVALNDPGGSIFGRTTLLQNSWESQYSQYSGSKSNENFNSDTNSVGDYVQGVHGGKYQFEEVGGATFAGRQFAESLYSSGSDENEDTILIVLNEPIPEWAERMGTAAKLGVVKPMERFPVLTLSASSPSTTITVSNDERSWEYYFSKLVQVSSDGSVLDDAATWCHENQSPVVVSPAVGHLAPRGGSSNLCDPNKPYSDSAAVQIQLADESLKVKDEGTSTLLVVGSEAEVWPYWIQID